MKPSGGVLYADLNAVPYPTAPVVPYLKTVHDRISMEIARGCTRGCRFCQAGYIYRPVRERSPEKVLEIIDRLSVTPDTTKFPSFPVNG